MKALGTVLLVLGVVGIILALVNHFSTKLLAFSHASTVVGVVGVVLLVVGGLMAARKA